MKNKKYYLVGYTAEGRVLRFFCTLRVIIVAYNVRAFWADG
jgi:hypothetical protein